MTAKPEWEQAGEREELPVEFYQLRKQHLEQNPQSKSRGMHVFVKPLTIEKLEVLSWIAGVNKSQCLNLLLDDNNVFTYLASVALRHAKKTEVNDARRFRVLARTEERRNGLGQLNIESQELYSHLKDKEAFFQEYAYIRCLQEFYYGNGELDKWSQETNRLDRMLKTLVSNRGSLLVNGSFMDFVSSMEYKYELFREDMLKRQFLVTDEELQSKYKYANPLVNSDVFTAASVASATSERTPSILESEAPEVPNLLASNVYTSAESTELSASTESSDSSALSAASELSAASDTENSATNSSIPVTLDSSLLDAGTSGVDSSIRANSDSSSSDSETASTIQHPSSIQDSSHAQNSIPTPNSSTVSNSNTVLNSVVAELASILDLSSGAPENLEASSTISASSESKATSSALLALSKLVSTLHTLQDSSASRLSSAVALSDYVATSTTSTTLTTSRGAQETTQSTLHSGLDAASLSIAQTTPQTTSRHALESAAASGLSHKLQGKQEYDQSHRLHSQCQLKNSNSSPAPQALASQASKSQASSSVSDLASVCNEPTSNTCSAASTFKAKSKSVSNKADKASISKANKASTSSTSNDTGTNEVSGLSGVRKVSKVRRINGISNEGVDAHTSSSAQETSVQAESEQADTLGMQELIDVLRDMLIRAK